MNPRESTASLTRSVAPLGGGRSDRDRSPHFARARTASPHSARTHDAFELVLLEGAGPCNHAAQIDALTRRLAHLEARLPVQNDQPSKFYQSVADCMWYVGHVISMGSLLSRISLPAAGVMVGMGQLLTILSRPVGRMREKVRGASDDTA
jgi:hypothetical protein